MFTVSFANSPFTNIDTAIIRRCHRWCSSARKVFLQISQNSQEITCAKVSFLMKLQIYREQVYQTRHSGTNVSCELCEISHNTFFKQPFSRPLLHKHSFCLLSHDGISPFQKRCLIYFPPEYFIGLICRLGTRVSSIFQTLSQKSKVCFQPSGTSAKKLFMQK